MEKYDFLNFIVTVSKMSKILREISFILAEECTINLNMYSAVKRMEVLLDSVNKQVRHQTG